MAQTNDKIRFQMMQNRLYLSNYLLSGDTREVDRLNDGARMLQDALQIAQGLANSEQQKAALAKVQSSEQNWARDFAAPLTDKRKDVDSGNATVAELQIFYLQKDAFFLGQGCHRFFGSGGPGKHQGPRCCGASPTKPPPPRPS